MSFNARRVSVQGPATSQISSCGSFTSKRTRVPASVRSWSVRRPWLIASHPEGSVTSSVKVRKRPSAAAGYQPELAPRNTPSGSIVPVVSAKPRAYSSFGLLEPVADLAEVARDDRAAVFLLDRSAGEELLELGQRRLSAFLPGERVLDREAVRGRVERDADRVVERGGIRGGNHRGGEDHGKKESASR
jgi:hypothetical protein